MILAIIDKKIVQYLFVFSLIHAIMNLISMLSKGSRLIDLWVEGEDYEG